MIVNHKRVLELLLLMVAVLAGSLAFGQGSAEFQYVQGVNLHGVFFVDETHGWTAADGGRIGHWDNSAGVWMPDVTPDHVRSTLLGVFFRNDGGQLSGWACGENGIVLAWNPNAGFNGEWEEKTIPPNPTANPPVTGTRVIDELGNPAKLTAIQMLTVDVGWVTGYDGSVRQTTDGGTHWAYPSCGTIPPDLTNSAHLPYDVYDIHFFDATNGIMCADHALVYRTSDGGCNWSEVSAGLDGTVCPDVPAGADGIELWQMGFEAPADWLSAGWVTGGQGTNRGYLFHKDYGTPANAPWSQFRCYDDAHAASQEELCGVSTTYAVAALGTTGIQMVCGGYGSQSMAIQPVSPPTIIPSTFDPCTGHCGTNGLTTTCGSTILVEYEPALDSSGLPSAPAFHHAARVSATKACFVGLSGRITFVDTVNTTPPTVSFTDTATKDFLRIRDGEFLIDPVTLQQSIGYVACQGGVIKKTTDKGQTWNDENLFWTPTLALDLWAIDISSTGAKVAVGNGGFIVVYDAVDNRWELAANIPPPPLPNLYAVAFAPNSNVVYAAGTSGYVLKCVDGSSPSTEWKVVGNSFTSETLFGISFATDDIGYVAGTNHVIYKTTTGGRIWNPESLSPGAGYPDEFQDIVTWGTGSNAVAVGSGGMIFEKDGLSFIPVVLGPNAVSSMLTDVEAIGTTGDLRICGKVGVVLFRTGVAWTKPKSQTSEDMVRLTFTAANQGYGLGGAFFVSKYD